MTGRHYMHMSNWAGLFAYPVDVISSGKKFATVKLLHKTHVGREHFPAGTIRRRVPIWSLTPGVRLGAMVSVGGGRFK